MSSNTHPQEQAFGPPTASLRPVARRALWSLPVWSLLLFLSTLTHQPDPATEFEAYARYITTDRFLVSHIVASIVGAGVGMIGFMALFLSLSLVSGRVGRLPLVALVAAVFGNSLVTSVFGVAAFAQPAIGEAYLAGETAQAVAFDEDVYSTPLFATAGVGLVLFAAGITAFGIAVQRAHRYPPFAGIVFAIGGLLFAIVGFLFVDILQPVGALLMALSTAAMAIGRKGNH